MCNRIIAQPVHAALQTEYRMFLHGVIDDVEIRTAGVAARVAGPQINSV